MLRRHGQHVERSLCYTLLQYSIYLQGGDLLKGTQTQDDFSDRILTQAEELEFEKLKRSNTLPLEIDRRRDRYFKFLMCAPERKSILLDFINTTLQLMQYMPLVSIELTDRELDTDFRDGKTLRLDILGTAEDGRMVNIELQRRSGGEFIKRALYNSGTLIHRQLNEGSSYNSLCQTIFVGLLDFSLFTDSVKWYWDFTLQNSETRRVLTDDLLILFVEMKKLDTQLDELRKQAKENKLDTKELSARLALWGGYISNKGVDVVAQLTQADPVFKEVLKAEEDYWGDKRNRFIQYLEEKAERDVISDLEWATQQGIKKGKLEGKLEGILEGERIKAFETAKNLLRMGLDGEKIALATGLSVEDVASLNER